MGFGSNFRCRGAAGAYGPHGLVGYQNTGELLRGQRARAAGELAAEDCFGQAGVALFLGFSQANDGGETAGKSHQGLLGDVVIGLAKKLAALGVADDDVAAADVGKHRSGDFAGEGAFLAPGNVLAGDGDARAFCGIDGGRERGERRRDGNVAMFCVRNKREEGGEKRARLRERFVHFPIAGDYAASHAKTSGRTKDLNTEDTESTEKKGGHLLVKASTPGSLRPPRNSREAPPPVEICEILLATPDWWTAATESRSEERRVGKECR